MCVCVYVYMCVYASVCVGMFVCHIRGIWICKQHAPQSQGNEPTQHSSLFILFSLSLSHLFLPVLFPSPQKE